MEGKFCSQGQYDTGDLTAGHNLLITGFPQIKQSIACSQVRRANKKGGIDNAAPVLVTLRCSEFYIDIELQAIMAFCLTIIIVIT